MKLSSFRLALLAVASTALLSPAIASQGAPSSGDDVAELARAKATYERGITALTDSLTNLLEEMRRGLTPTQLPPKFDLIAVNEEALLLDQEILLLESEGVWPASVAAVTSTGNLSALKIVLEQAYNSAWDGANRREDARARQSHKDELAAFRAATDLAKWRSIFDSAILGTQTAPWIRSNGGLLSPKSPEGASASSPLRFPVSAVPWHRQYRLEFVIAREEGKGGVRLTFLDAGGHPVDYLISGATLDTALANRVFDQPGALLLITVQDTIARVEVEGRTLELTPLKPAEPPIEAPSSDTYLLQLLPEGNARIRLQSIAWKPLRGAKEEVVRPPIVVEDERRRCTDQPIAELASITDLARAKAAYEDALREHASQVIRELKLQMQRNQQEDALAAEARVSRLEHDIESFEKDGVRPATFGSTHVLDLDWVKLRNNLTRAYSKAGAEANRLDLACTRMQLTLELDSFQRYTDLAEWRNLLADRDIAKGQEQWLPGDGGLTSPEAVDANKPPCALRFTGEFRGGVPKQYKIEFLLSRKGTGEGVWIRGLEPSTGPFEHHVSKVELDAGIGGGIFGKQGARFLVLAQPGYARIEVEGRTLWQRSTDDLPTEALSETSAPPWLEITPDAGTRLTARALQWKPLVEQATQVDESSDPKKAAPGLPTVKPAGNLGHLADGLAWLKHHQSPDGSWDCDGFKSNCGHVKTGSTCDGPGMSRYDVGVTGLALLAFLGDGNTTSTGDYKEQVAKAVGWLKDQQDEESGLYGQNNDQKYMYGHAIATLAMCEASSSDPGLKSSAQSAVNFILKAQNPYSGWRYAPSDGENDTSVTGWMITALKAAQVAKLEINQSTFQNALNWFNEMTDPVTGRTGYTDRGGASGRETQLMQQFPAEKSEACTAISIRFRALVLKEKIGSSPLLKLQVERLMKLLPEWDSAGSNDIYYWYYGTFGLRQVGGSSWTTWRQEIRKTLEDNQVRTGDALGSWDPVDAWGKQAGGRVYMTAMAVLCLEEARRVR